MESNRITKVEYKGDKLKIEWEEYRNGHFDKKSIESKIEPHQDFVNSMRAMDKPLCIEAELPNNDDEYKRHDVQVVKINYDEDEQGNTAINVSIQSERFMETTMETMKIVSPMKCETGEFRLDDLTVESVENLINEASLYLDGKRHDLFSMTAETKDAVGH